MYSHTQPSPLHFQLHSHCNHIYIILALHYADLFSFPPCVQIWIWLFRGCYHTSDWLGVTDFRCKPFINVSQTTILSHCFSLSSFVVLMLRMASPWVAVHWTLRLARVLVWYFRPTSLTVSAASLSSTALTRTSTSRPKLCPATHPLPATCEYFKHILSISISNRTAKVFQEETGKNLLKIMMESLKDKNKMMF